MHYSVLCIVLDPGDGFRDVESVRSLVDEAMAPHENDLFDWYQIGGRWTGAFDGYEADKDPCNIEKCPQCSGSGMRDDDIGRQSRMTDPSYTCNGCSGKGERPVWPTARRARDGDVVPLDSLTQDQYQKFYAVVCGGSLFESETYEPWALLDTEKFKPKDLPPLEWLKTKYAGRLAVVVDCHN